MRQLCRTYTICYTMSKYDTEREIEVKGARTNHEAYDLAVYRGIPEKEGRMPYGAYVDHVICKNGKKIQFNNLIGKPY